MIEREEKFDPDTERFYMMERALRSRFGEGKHLTFEECVDLGVPELGTGLAQRIVWVNAASRRISEGVGGTFTVERTSKDGPIVAMEIGIPPTRQHAWAVLHEVAHARTVDEGFGHGPQFVEECFRLWIKHGIWSSQSIDEAVVEFGVSIREEGAA